MTTQHSDVTINSDTPTSARDRCDSLLGLLREIVRACKEEGASLAEIHNVVEAECLAEPSDNKMGSRLGIEDDAGQVLSHWHDCSEYIDESGLPRKLDEDTQFTAICAEVGSRSAPEEILRVLLEARAVTRTSDGLSVASRRIIMPTGASESSARVSRLARAYFRTLLVNTQFVAPESKQFERTVSTTRLDPRQIPALTSYLGLYGQAFLEDLDGWITAREVAKGGQSVAVGLFLFSE